MKRNKAIFAVLLALCTVLMFAGCGIRSKSASYSAREYYEEPQAAYEMAYDSVAEMEYGNYAEAKAAGKVSTTASAKVNGSGESASVTGAVTGRKIIKNGDLSIQTREFDEFLENLNRSILAAGG